MFRAGSKALRIIPEVLLPTESIARRDKRTTPSVFNDDVSLVDTYELVVWSRFLP
jgi:hypothetical protein